MPRKPKIGPPSLTETTSKFRAKRLSINFQAVGEKADKEFKKLVEYHEQEKKILQETFEYLKHAYLETKNPLFAWDARSVARNWNMAAPKWVEEYLDRVGKKLLQSDGNISDIAECLEANGTWGRKTVFEYRREWCMKDTAVDIAEWRYKEAKKKWQRLKKQYRYKEQIGPCPQLKDYAKEVVVEANRHWKPKRALTAASVLKHRDERAKSLKTK